MPTLSLHKWKLPYLSEDRASATSDLTSLLEMLLFRVSWIRAITISQVYQFAITFHLFGDMALPYILCLRCAIFYVLNALGSICRPMDFCTVQTAPTTFLLSTCWHVDPTSSSSSFLSFPTSVSLRIPPKAPSLCVPLLHPAPLLVSLMLNMKYDSASAHNHQCSTSLWSISGIVKILREALW